MDDVLPDGKGARPGADKVLSILRMEGVWMYAVTGQRRAAAEEALRRAGLDGAFRGLLTEEETGCPACSARMLEKAMRRLRSSPADTVVFAGRLEQVRAAAESGLRSVAVFGAADAGEWEEMRSAADYDLVRYEDWLKVEQT